MRLNDIGESNSETTSQPTGGCRKPLRIGCTGVLLLLLILIGLIGSNWSTFTGYYRNAKSTLSGMAAVQAALESKYGGKPRILVTRDSRVQGSLLVITLVNPSLIEHVTLDGPDGRRLAFEVADTANSALQRDERYDNYEIVFERQGGSGNAATLGHWSFRFTATELATEHRLSLLTSPSEVLLLK